MPPKVKFRKEEIVQAALDVARVKGADGVTARDIAAQLGVSTRPIFTYFNTMDEVKTAVRQAAEQVYQDYTAKGLNADIPFLGFGLQYLRFAEEEPELYKLLFLTPPCDENKGWYGTRYSASTASTPLPRTGIFEICGWWSTAWPPLWSPAGAPTPRRRCRIS